MSLKNSRLLVTGAFFLFCLFAESELYSKTSFVTPGGTFELIGERGSDERSFFHLLVNNEEKFQGLTGYPVSADPPVLVVLHPFKENPSLKNTLRVDSLEGRSTKIQIDCSYPPEVNGELGEILARAMLLRKHYANQPPQSGVTIRSFPSWLTRGIGLVCNPGAGFVLSSELTPDTEVPSLEKFLCQKAPVSGSDQVLEAYNSMAALAVKAGMRGEGAKAFRDWIGHFNAKDPRVSFSDWPDSWSLGKVERLWLLLIAGQERGDEGTLSILGTISSLKKYDEILSGLPTQAHSIALLKKEKGGIFTSQQLTSRLSALRLQANPLVIPLIDRTLNLLSQINRQSLKKLLAEEKKISDLQGLILKQSRAIEDYLDWYEMTKTRTKSGLFERFLAAPLPPVKKGPVGRYLDAVEERGW